MPDLRRRWSTFLVLALVALLLGVLPDALMGQEPVPELFITGDDVTTPPGIVLHVYGRDAQGAAIDFTNNPLVVTEDGGTIETTIDGTYPGGTFTVFLIDIPTGVSQQIPIIQDALRQFASPTGGMQEQTDYMAIYQVGEAEARQLLEPTNFYNTVQNFFVDPLQPDTGTTALIDSTASLLGQLEELKPEPDMVMSLVVMSDGTDVVSTEFEAADVVARANELKIPVHTIWVNSTDLTLAGQQQGQAYLSDTSANTRGLYTTLDDAAGVAGIWERIAGFREQARVRYEPLTPQGGTYDIRISLASDPAAAAERVVTVPENQPVVELNLPEDSRSMTLPNLDEPVRVSLGATVSWLDGLERGVEQATLRVNGRTVAEIPVEELDQFTAEINNFTYGSNTIEVAVQDSQSLVATSQPVVLNLAEGPREVPADLQPGPGIGRIILNIFLILLVIAAVAGLIYFVFVRSRGNSRRRRSRRRRSSSTPASGTWTGTADAGTATEPPVAPKPSTYIMAQLEVLESQTEMPSQLRVDGTLVALGRSPAQSDIAFREDLTVSRRHATLHLEGNHYRIYDEQSTSGTWVNGRQVPEYGIELTDGDEISLGAVRLRYRQL